MSQVHVPEFPVHQPVQKYLGIISPPVLVIQIISVFPHIQSDQWPVPLSYRVISISCFHYLYFAISLDKPGPPTSKLGHGSLFECLCKLGSSLVSLQDLVSYGAYIVANKDKQTCRFSASSASHGSPIEGMVPSLGCVVKDCCGVWLAPGV